MNTDVLFIENSRHQRQRILGAAARAPITIPGYRVCFLLSLWMRGNGAGINPLYEPD
jgi:hypothetical protein